MAKFLWSGKIASGEEVVDEVEAESAEAARKIMEERGCTELRLHSGEINNFVDEQMRKASQEDYQSRLSPKQKLEFLDGKATGIWRSWFKAVIESGETILFILILFVFAVYTGNKLLPTFYLVLLAPVLLLFPVLYWWFSRTPKVFRQLHTARNWRRWNEVLECIEKLKKLQKQTKIGVAEVELERYRALAFAGLGRLDEALSYFSTAADKAKMPQWLFYSQVATIYTAAKDYDLGLESYRLALQATSNKSTVCLDMGSYLVTRFDQPSEARELLMQAENCQLTEIEKCYVPFLRGKILFREGDFVGVDKNIREALGCFERRAKRNYFIFEPSILVCKGYLAVSCAALADKAAAKNYFAQSEKYLTTTCLDDIIAKYHEMKKDL